MSVVYCHTCRGRVAIDVDCDDVTHEHDPPGRIVTYCHTCGGHVGMAGSLGEHCAGGAHQHETERWSSDDERFWGRYYTREAQRQKIQADAEAQRLSIPLLARLRACGVHPTSDGIMSIHPADWRDAHDAADAIDALLTVAGTLSEGDASARDDARRRLTALRTALGVEGPTPD